MKNNLRRQPQNLFHTYTACALLLLLANLPLRAQTQSNCLTYSTTGLYTYTVPAGGPFLIRATVRGADGGAKGGSGATVVSSFAVQSGDQLTIMVGQVGQANYSGQASQVRDLSGGGGGSAVILNHNQTLSLLLAAGAGGGSSLNWDIPGGGGQGIGLASGGAGGSVYEGSSSAYSAGGGGGGLDAPGSGGGSGAFAIPGSGGGQASLTTLSPGGEYGGGSGFGGGGGCSLSYRGGPGGGGGYGGGRGGNGGDPIGGLDGYEIPGPAQGGYSFISPVGSTTAITPGTDGGSQLRDGLVSLDFPNNTATASITSANTAICAGQSTTLTGSVTATGTWTLVLSDGTTTTGSGSSFAITVTPPVSTTYTIQCLTDANGVAHAANLTGSQEVTVNPNPTPTLSNNGPLTCFDPTVTLTATLAEPDPGSTFWFSTTTTPSTSPTTPVSESGIYSVTVVATGGCSGVASTTVTSIKTTPSAPTLIANVTTPVFQNTPGVSLTISGCSTGNLTWTGPGGVTGTSTTVLSVPTSATGTLVYSATCTLGSCTSTASTTITVAPPLIIGSFDGFVYGADCATFRGWAWDRNKPNTAVSVDILDGPNVIASLSADVFRQDLQTAGKGNGRHAFFFTIPTELKDGLPHNLSARVSGSSFILKDSPKALICEGSGTPSNKAPVPPSPTVLIAPLAAQVGVPFAGTLVAFTDPEGQPLTYQLGGLPTGLAINATSRVISGTPTEAGTFVLTYSASDGVLTNSVSFPLNVNPASTTTVTGSFEGYLDKLDCGGIRGWVWDRNKPNTPLTVEFYLDGSGTVLGSTVANIYRVDLKDAGKGNGAHAYNFTPPGSVTNGTLIRARVLGSTYDLKGSPKAYQCAPARLSAETASQLQVTVLGNPVSEQVAVEIRGAEGQPLKLQLTDASGRLIGQRHIEASKPVEQQRFSVQAHAAGLFLLRVSSPSQSLTLKVLKQ